MAVTYTNHIAVNEYVSSQSGYGSPFVTVTLDEATFNVVAVPTDQFNNPLSGASDLVNETFADFATALSAYESICRQLYEGDVIRNLNHQAPASVPGVTDPNNLPQFEA